MDESRPLEVIQSRLKQAADLRAELAASGASQIAQAARILTDCLRNGGKVLVFGNGGSAADAQHFAAELVGRFAFDRDPLPAIALTTDTSALTAIANDYGFENVFVRQIRALTHSDDVAVAISTSGRSVNVTAATRAARSIGAETIALTGGSGGTLAPAADVAIVVPSSNTARIQEMHISVIHLLCELIEDSLFGKEPRPALISEQSASKVVGWADLLILRESWGRDGKTVVWTNGCFDLLHVGHVYSLEHAKQFGDVLVVGVNTDDAVRTLKGPEHPVFSLEDRLRMLAALDVTDHVVAFEGLTPEKALQELKPDFHVKGSDYAGDGKAIPEKGVVEAYGGRVEFVPLLPGYSTTAILERVRKQRGPEID